MDLNNAGSELRALRQTVEGLTRWRDRAQRDIERRPIHSASPPTEAVKTRLINAPEHGFEAGQVVALDKDTGDWILADASSFDTCRAIGIITGDVSTNYFRVTTSGYVDTAVGLTAGTLYYISDTTPGQLSDIQGAVSFPIFVAETETTGWVVPWGPQTSPAISINVHKVGHGVLVGTIAVNSGAIYNGTGSSSGYPPLSSIGICTEVIDADNFTLTLWGDATIAGAAYTPGKFYWWDGTGFNGNTSAFYPEEFHTNPLVGTLQPMAVFFAISATRIYVLGPDVLEQRLPSLRSLYDVWITSPSDGQVLSFDAAANNWKNNAFSTAALGSHSAISVLGRSANSSGTLADIAASTTGDVLHMGASALEWGQLQTASYADSSVTAVKISGFGVSNLSDAAITSIADLDFLRYDAGSSKWKNTSLGPIGYNSGSGVSDPSQNVFYFGNNTAGTLMNVGVANGSRLLVDNNSSLEFLVRGAVHSSDKWASLRVSSNNVSFQDDGTEVLSWVCSATAASRIFKFKVPISIVDGTAGAPGSDALIIAGSGTTKWIAASGGGTNVWLTFDAAFGGANALIYPSTSDLGLNGKSLFMTGAGLNARISGDATHINLNSNTGTVAVSGALTGDSTAVFTSNVRTNGAFNCLGTAGLASQVATLAKITVGGTNGSITITGGIVTAYTAPT